MSDRLEDHRAWRAGWQRAETLALKTLSGLQLDAKLTHPNALFRAHRAQVKLWERLCSRELRTEDDVKAASNKLALIFETDNQHLSASGDTPIAFNKFQPVGQGTRIVTELEWMADVYECGLGDAMSHRATLADFDLEGWKSWEIIYVTGLRAIDDAVKALHAGDIELGMSLTFDALDEMYRCDVFANGNERDQDYSARVASVYGQKPGNGVAIEEHNEAVREAVKTAVKQDRIELAKAAAIKRHKKNAEMRELVIARWQADGQSYGGNKSDFARHYARRLLQEHEFAVEATTIATRWLRGL